MIDRPQKPISSAECARRLRRDRDQTRKQQNAFATKFLAAATRTVEKHADLLHRLKDS